MSRNVFQLSVHGVLLCVLSIPSLTQAEASLEITNCAELKDDTISPLVNQCSRHIGCGYVLNTQKTCARAKSYLERLNAAIGEGTKGFFGYRKEVTPDAIFMAALGDEERSYERKLDKLTAKQHLVQKYVPDALRKGMGDTLTGKATDGGKWVYYGQTAYGKPSGVGARFFSSGQIQQGKFSAGRLGYGTRVNENSIRLEGSFRDDGSLEQGRVYRADGSIWEAGNFERGELFIGYRYDTAGNSTFVSIPAEREAVARVAEHKAQRQRQLGSANQARRPVASPNLDQLIEQTLGAKKWG